MTLGASPAGKSVGLPSLASLISSDSSRDVFQQRVQVNQCLHSFLECPRFVLNLFYSLFM